MRCLFVLLLLSTTSTLFNAAEAQQPVVITYAGGYRGNLIPVEKIKANQLTHILYAFADLKNKRAFLHYPKTDRVNLKNLVAIRRPYPDLKILLSVGGLGWSRNFSDMALTTAGRQTFTQSCIELVRQFDLDGIDIDWEFPGYPGEGGNIYRPEDKQNFTLLFKMLRESFDDLQKQTGKHILITVATDGWASHFLPHTEMGQVQQYVDYVCLMAYNFNTPQQAGGHFLYSPSGWNEDGSGDGAVKAFMKAGVPANKLVLGAGFFPAAFQMQSSNPKDRNYKSRIAFHGGLARAAKLSGHDGYKRYWDADGKAPYLFNTDNRIRISYEDTTCVCEKCTYIRSHKLAGIMYWDYFSDPGRTLLSTINNCFKQ